MIEVAGAPSSSTTLRWTTLIVVAAKMTFIADQDTLGKSPTIARLADGYGDTFVPAGFAKGIGVVLLVAFPLFYVVAFWRRRRYRRTYDKLVIPLMLTSTLALSWIVALRHERIGLSVASIAGIVA